MKLLATQPRDGAVAAGRIAQVRPLVYALALTTTVAIAIGVRLAFWWMQSRSGAVQPGDSQEYVQGALHLLRGDFATGDKWLRPPLYPAFLAAAFVLVGVDITRAMLVQAIVTGLGVLAFAALGHTVFGRRDVALISALIAATFVPFATYGSVLFAEALFAVLIAWSFALLLRGTKRDLVLGGVLFGLATLTRAVGLFFLPIAFVALLLDRQEASGIRHQASGIRIRHQAGGIRHQAIRNSRYSILFVIAAILTIAPWTIRNFVAYDRFIPVDTNGGVSFWYGNLHRDEDRIAGEAKLAQIPNPADKQRAAVGMAIKDIAEDPGRFVSRVRNKVVALWQLSSRNYAAGGIVSFGSEGHSLGLTPGELPLPLSLLADAQYVLLLIGGVWGFCLAPRDRRSMLLLLWVIFGTAMSALTLGHPRLRLPLLVAFVPYAAWALLQLRSLMTLARQNRRMALVAAGSTLLFLGLIWTNQYIRWTRAQLAMWRGDRSDPALFEQAYAINSANPLWLMVGGDRAAEEGDWQQAERLYAAAAKQEPRSLYARTRLIESALQRGDNAEAQAQLDAIRALDRDNNDLLRWAWSHLTSDPPPSIDPTEARALGNIRGFVPVQPGESDRWTMRAAQLRILPTANCTAIELTLRGHSDGQPLQVGVGGRFTEIAISRSRTTYRVPLEAGICRANDPLEITLQTQTAVLHIDRQPWAVGVALKKISSIKY
jgi:hypothetical protein